MQGKEIEKWFFELLSSEPFISYYKNTELVSKNGKEPYKSYFGLNIKDGKLSSLKIYFTWYRELTKQEIETLLLYGTDTDFYENYQKRSNHFNIKEGGSGYTFSLKYNPNSKLPVFGYYYKINVDDGDEFYSLTETIEYQKLYNKVPEFDQQKMIYNEFDFNNHKIENRSLYYIKDNLYKDILAKKFNEPFVSKANEIEFCTGLKSNGSTYRKAILIIDLPEFKRTYSKTPHGSNISDFLENMKCFSSLTPICPGLYQPDNAESIYLINVSDFSNLKIRTVEEFLKNNIWNRK